MKTLIVASMLAAVAATPAAAISRYNTDGMSCGETQRAVRAEGAAILRYTSKRTPGMTLYDRFVRHGGYCQTNEIAVQGYVPTADRSSCPIKRCEPASRHFDNDEIFVPR